MLKSTFVTFGFVLTATTAGADCKDPDLAKIPKGATITMCDGSTGTGTFSHSESCTADGQTDCLVSGNFKAAAVEAFSTYDVRQGKTIAGIKGAHKDCRNGISNTLYNYDGAVTSITSAVVTTGTAADWWDTVDDYAADPGQANSLTAPGGTNFWNENYLCDGAQIKDVTNSSATLTPASGKILWDQYSNLYFTSPLAAGTLNWSDAVKACHNFDSGNGIGKWRLPTQMELQVLYVNGVSLVNQNLLGGQLTGATFWPATSDSLGSANAWYVQLWGGRTIPTNAKTTLYSVICVR